MMTQRITATWQSNMAFSSDIDGHTVITDAPESIGGTNSGPSPKKLMMASLAGCSGIDVAMILGKMRVEVDDFSIEVSGELSDGEPSVYTRMHLRYVFAGKNLPFEKLQRAVQLSQEKYCGVSIMYARIMDISWEIVLKE
ncbi:MAG: osmotically inducible protein C [Deltaproteobacteria bacterium]|nr:MAG: osmotically inducible protein C [Deltaproteobacteria bacterium]